MLAIQSALESHLDDYAESARALRNEVASMNVRFDSYHAENARNIAAIKTINEDQMVVLDAIVAAKRVSIWAGRTLKALLGLLATAASALGLYTFFRAH